MMLVGAGCGLIGMWTLRAALEAAGLMFLAWAYGIAAIALFLVRWPEGFGALACLIAVTLGAGLRSLLLLRLTNRMRAACKEAAKSKNGAP
jgi:hypothetical protein